jgi:hypothetical protein
MKKVYQGWFDGVWVAGHASCHTGPGGNARRSIVEFESFAERGFGIYNEHRVSGPRGLGDSYSGKLVAKLQTRS